MNIDFCFTSKGGLKSSVNRESFWKKHNAIDILAQIKEKTSFLENDATVTQRLYHVKNGIYETPLCDICDKKVKWKNGSYPQYCSRKCWANSAAGKETRSKNMSRLNNDAGAMEKRKESCDRFRNSRKYEEYRRRKSEQAMQQHKDGSLGSVCLSKYFNGRFIGSEDQVARSRRLKEYNQKHKLDLSRKRKETLIEKYGVENYAMTEGFKNKIKQSAMDNYGVPHHNQRHYTREGYRKLIDSEYIYKYLETFTLEELSAEIGIDKRTIQRYYPGLSKSEFENEVANFITCILPDSQILTNSRKVIAPYELDIFLPEHNIGIECNGSYWHAENQGRDKKYHLEKLKCANENSLSLIQIWEHDWNAINEIVKGRIKSKLGVSERIYARKTTVNEISSKEVRYFLDKNHIQGYSASSVNYGLYNSYDELVAVMTFSKSRFSKKYDWELVRYCSLIGTNVVGGASKLFKRFLKDYTGTVVSYSCKMWNSGILYKALGFEHIRTSSPNYYYTSDYRAFESRIKYQKHKLKHILSEYDCTLSEWENMKNNGYDRIWDCGNDVWVYHTS